MTMKGKYKRAQGWCDHCDRDIVEAGKKCKCCGNRQPAQKISAKERLRQIIREATLNVEDRR